MSWVERLYNAYMNDGFTVHRVISKEQRAKSDAKAHVIMEQLRFDFKYLPRKDAHLYMFKTEEQAQEFEKLLA